MNKIKNKSKKLNQKNMSKTKKNMLIHREREFTLELTKRLVWVEEQDDTTETEEIQKGQKVIEEYSGINRNQACEIIENKSKVTEGNFKKNLESWNNFLLGREAWTNKGGLRAKIRKQAEEDAKNFVEGLKLDDSLKKIHTTSSLNILSHEISISEQLISDLDEEIEYVEGQLNDLKEALNGLSWWKKRRIKPYKVFSSETAKKLKNLQAMKKKTEEIKDEKEGKLNETKGEKHEKIKQWSEYIGSLLTKYSDANDEEIADAIAELGYKGKRTSIDGILKSAIGDSKKMPSDIAKVIEMYIDKIESGGGDISGEDVRGYFLLKKFSIAEVNKKTGLTEKIKALKTLMPLQKIKLGNGNYHLIKSDNSGYILKKDGDATLAYVDISAEHPVVTIQEKNNGTLAYRQSSFKEDNEDNSENTDSVVFGIEEKKKQKPLKS